MSEAAGAIFERGRASQGSLWGHWEDLARAGNEGEAILARRLSPQRVVKENALGGVLQGLLEAESKEFC